jgi:cytochrome c
VGPSYEQIADKYELNQGNIENLANKIIKGGKGLWGSAAMTPHPNLPEAQAQEMARYILELRNAADTTK